MIEYVAKFEPVNAEKAEREFFVRSFRELRFWRTVLPPVVFAAALAATYVMHPPTWAKIAMWVFFVLSVVVPPFFYLVLPAEAARRARKFPTRRVRLTVEGFEMQVGARES